MRHSANELDSIIKSASLIFLFLSFTASAAPVPSPLRFHFEESESTTAVYHLACLAGNIPCTKENFETYWHTKLVWTTADQAELDAWSAILVKVSRAALPPDPAPYIGNTPGLWPAVTAQHQVIRAALETRSLPDFQTRTWQWIESEEAARLYRAIAHFRTRLHPSQRQEVKALLPQIAKEMHKSDAPALATQMAHFLESDIKTQDVYFHAVPGPIFDSDRAKATPVLNHVFMEVISSAKPVPAASILLHELTHSLYDAAPAQKQAALMQQFAQSGNPEASSLYALLNEAIAVAGQAKEDGFRDPFIPRLGRSTTPLLKQALTSKTTLFQPGFVESYIREAMRELGPDARDPRFVLKSTAFSSTDKARAAHDLFLKEFPQVSQSDDWQAVPSQNLVFLTAYDEWGTLLKSLPELTSYTKKRAFVYVSSGTGGRTICVIAGTDSAAIVDAVKALTQTKLLPVSGLVLALD